MATSCREDSRPKYGRKELEYLCGSATNIDPVTELPHIYRHHVTEDEVESILVSRHKIFAEQTIHELLLARPRRDDT